MTTTRTPITLYRYTLSGHAHKAQLMLSLLGLPHRLVDIDLLRGEQKAADFIARNLFAQVPVIEDGDFTLADSNAILVYLALQYDAERRWLPADVRVQAEVHRWLGASAGQRQQWVSFCTGGAAGCGIFHDSFACVPGPGRGRRIMMNFHGPGFTGRRVHSRICESTAAVRARGCRPQ